MKKGLLDAPTLACDFEDPIGALVHCHLMIDRQLALLEEGSRMLRRGGRKPPGPALGRLDAVKAHFAGPGDRHTQDEEASLFPRLRARERELGSRVLDVLDALEAEHRIAEAVHAGFREAVEEVRRRDFATAAVAARVASCVSALAWLYRSHMRFENEVILPTAARILGPDDLRALGSEMRARRSPEATVSATPVAAAVPSRSGHAM
jgi:hemerythrin-like domain-containing protein